MTCNHNCDQGRTCTCLPITMEDEPLITFEKVMDYIVTLLAGVGMVSVIVMIAFWLGYSK